MESLDLLAALVLEDGRRWGDAAESWQWTTARHVLDPGSPPNLWDSRPRGGSKTTDIGAVCIVLLASALPPGSGIDAFAADRDQARLIIDAIRGFVARTPSLAGVLDVDAYKVRSNTGCVLEVLAADAASAWGRKPTVAIADEVCQWPNATNARALWQAVVSSLGKVKRAKLVCLTTSGDPAHWTHRIFEQAKRSRRWRVQEVPGPLPWADPDFLAEQRGLLPDSVYRRLHLNEWAAPEDRLTSLDDLRACVDHEGPLEPVEGHHYVIGVDLGLKHDRSVAAVCHAEGDGERKVVLDRMEVWAGTPRRPVDLPEVRDWLEFSAKRYRAPLVVDPYQAIGMIQELRRRGVVAEEFNFNQSSIGRLAVTLHTSVRDHRLGLPDDAELLDELANVRLRETSPNVYRMDHDPDRHDDRAIALALAAEKLLTLVPIRRARMTHVSRPHRPDPLVNYVAAGWLSR
jgi:phage terminase large subunit-like protein